MKEKSMFEKIFEFINTITTEYIIGTSVYLLTVFVLSVSKNLNWINFAYWLVLFNFIFEKFLLKKTQNSNGFLKNRLLSLIIRVLFISINVVAFGIDIIVLK